MSTKATFSSLEGRTVLITGGASGIGAAIVRGFARNRARVAFLDVDREAGEALAAELGALFLPCDLTDVDALRAAAADVESRLGPVQALVNNAGNDQRHALEDITPEQWDASLSINIRQQFFMAQAVAPGMQAAGGGAIVNLSSTALLIGMPDLVPVHERQGRGDRHDAGRSARRSASTTSGSTRSLPGAVMTAAADGPLVHAREQGGGGRSGRRSTTTCSRTTSPTPRCSCPPTTRG